MQNLLHENDDLINTERRIFVKADLFMSRCTDVYYIILPLHSLLCFGFHFFVLFRGFGFGYTVSEQEKNR